MQLCCNRNGNRGMALRHLHHRGIQYYDVDLESSERRTGQSNIQPKSCKDQTVHLAPTYHISAVRLEPAKTPMG